MVGKTTIYELLTKQRDFSSNTMKANMAIATIPDYRIDNLTKLVNPRKTIYAQIEVIDIPGLIPGAESNAAIFLDAVRKADALLHVVRGFEDSMLGPIQPLLDIETINYELLLADLDLIEKRITRIENNKKKKQMLSELNLLHKLKNALENELPLSSVEIDEAEQEIMNTYQFLTTKPILICLNVSEEDLISHNYPDYEKIQKLATETGLQVVEVSAEIEKEIAELESGEREAFMEELELKESGIVRISRNVYEKLGLISFFTVGEVEVRAWTIDKGMSARIAAGKIHSDIERGFIRAEVVDYDDLMELGSMAAVKEKGLYRLEGKEYIVKDGDIVHFRFNV